MSISSRVLPERMLRLVSHEERAKHKLGHTAAEVMADGIATSEKQLQGMIVNYLRMKGLEVLWHRTDKKSAATIGWPDITFAFLGEQAGHTRIFACGFEVKMPDKGLEPHQQLMRTRMVTTPNAWSHRTITSLDQVVEFLRERGLP